MMKLFNTLAPATLLFSLLVSCTTTYQYGPGGFGSESRVLVTPASQDSAKTAHYASGRYSFNLGNGYNSGESSRFGELSYHLGHSRKFLVCAVGASVFSGAYRVEKFTQESGWKDFFGVNGSGQLALNIPLGKHLNWRIFGVRSGFSMEGGSLYDFRMRNRNIPGFNEYYDRQLIWNAGTFSEIQILVKEYRLGLQSCNAFLLGKGGFLGLNSSFSTYLGYRHYMLNYQLAGSSHGAYYHNLGLIFKFR
jgi:hypothetical protein